MPNRSKGERETSPFVKFFPGLVSRGRKLCGKTKRFGRGVAESGDLELPEMHNMNLIMLRSYGSGLFRSGLADAES